MAQFLLCIPKTGNAPNNAQNARQSLSRLLSPALMAEEQRQKAQGIPPRYDLNAKWDACLHRPSLLQSFVLWAGSHLYFSCFIHTGSPVTRWASVAFAAGVGIGSAYTDCSYIFDGFPQKISSSEVSSISSGSP
ncbi:unnamed protein product [Musa textilis]